MGDESKSQLGGLFPIKLHKMLDDVAKEGKEDIVSWNEDGRSFTIKKPHTFAETIMPRYFNQTRYKSFQRQLNLYQYTRLSRAKKEGIYSHPLFVKGNRDLCSYVRRASKNRSVMLPNSQLTQGLASSQFPAVDSSTQYMTTDSSRPADFGHLLQSIGGNGRNKGLPSPSLKGPKKSRGGTNKNSTTSIKGDSTPLGVIPGQEDEPTRQATTTSSLMALADFSLSEGEAIRVDLPGDSEKRNPMAFMNGFTTVPACGVAPHRRPVGTLFSEAPPGIVQYQRRTGVMQCKSSTTKKKGSPSFVSQDDDDDDDASIESIDDIPKDYMDGLDVHVSFNALF